MFEQLNLVAALPEIILLSGLSLLMLLNLFFPTRDHQGSLVGAALVLLATAAALLLQVTGHVPAFQGNILNHMYVADGVALWTKFFCVVLTLANLVFYQESARFGQTVRMEYHILALFALLGLMVMCSASHMLTLYVGLEVLSLALYALIALDRDNAKATEAAMKYFVLGALASGLLLYGMSMVYGGTGSLGIDAIAEKAMQGNADPLLVRMGVVFIVAAIAFKLGTVPFHMWVPDVYQGSATPTAMLIGSAPKIAAFALVMRLLGVSLHHWVSDWQSMLLILAALSLIIGNLVAIAQQNVKRMLAYSTIAHMGFLALGLLAGNKLGYSAAMFYAIAYAVTATAGFAIVFAVSQGRSDQENLAAFAGLRERSPALTVLMILVLCSMIGLPGLVGFWSKLYVLKNLIELNMYGLATLAVLTSLVGAFYYLRLIRIMVVDQAAPSLPDQAALRTSPWFTFVLLVSVGAVLFAGLFPDRLMYLCSNAVSLSLRAL